MKNEKEIMEIIEAAGFSRTGKIQMESVELMDEVRDCLLYTSVRIDQPDENIFLGVDAKVTIQAASVHDAVVLPTEVVNIGKEGSFCYVLEDGVIVRKNIETGLSSDDSVEIVSGILEGDKVLLDIGSLQEGMEAEAMPADGASSEGADSDTTGEDA